jgi:hypothetical protein
MTNELHWEWRGFGGVSGRFIEQYCDLPLITDSEIIKDLYLVIPELYVNTKFRTGAEGGLKFKRLKKREGDFEKWLEDTDELFDFPLDSSAWETFRDTLQQVGRDLPEYPQKNPDRETTLKYLVNAGCKPLEVEKNRESRLLEVSEGQVKVEWACLSKPQSLISIGIENWSDSGRNSKNDAAQKNELTEAIKKLNLDKEPLKAMNYLDAVKIWAEGDKI